MAADFLFKAVRVLEPVLVHYLAANLIMIISYAIGLHADAAFLTTITAVILLPLFLYMLKRDEEVRRVVGGKRGSITVGKGLGIAVFAVLCNQVMTWVMNMLLAIVTALYPTVTVSNQVQEELFSSQLAVQLVGLGILVPFMEEVLFRGLVYNRLKDYNKGWLSALLGSAIFALYHGNLVQMLFAFPMGLIITEVYRRENTLAAPVIFHIAVNASSVLGVCLF